MSVFCRLDLLTGLLLGPVRHLDADIFVLLSSSFQRHANGLPTPPYVEVHELDAAHLSVHVGRMN